jgi:4-hydroxythreonine-4-phosphate dehydrogenase
MLVVADDLSGAVEVAAVLGAKRIALGHTDGDVVDLDTRDLAPDEAARRVRALDGRITFKKIDSLLRGNVKAEIEALSGEVIVAPALPVEGRTVRGGVLHVHGVPQPRPPVALLDAETDEDLDAIVAGAPPHATLVGSAGLAAALGRRLNATPLPPPTPRDARLILGVGTRAADEQLTRLGHPPNVSVICDTAEAVAEAVAVAPPVDLVLTGGETARRTLDALGVTTLEPIAQIHHGAVQCRMPGGRHVTIRPGGFGGPDSLVQIVNALTCRSR